MITSQKTMSGDKSNIQKAIDSIINYLTSHFPNERVSLYQIENIEPIQPKIIWFSKAQDKVFPNGVNKICFKWMKGFGRACPECPNIRAVAKRKIQVGLIPTPSYVLKKNNGFSPDVDDGDVFYSFLVSVPIILSEEGCNYVLEFSYDLTSYNKKRHFNSIKIWEFILAIFNSIHTNLDEDTIFEFILFAAVSKKALGFRKATLYLLEEFGIRTINRDLLLKGKLTLERSENNRSEFEALEKYILEKPDEIELEVLRVNIFDHINAEEKGGRNFEVSLYNNLKEEGIYKPERIEQIGFHSNGVRLHSQKALIPLKSADKIIQSILMVETSPSRVVTEDCLKRLGKYSLLLSNILATVELGEIYDVSKNKFDSIIQSYNQDQESFFLMNSIISGMGHDLRNSMRTIQDYSKAIIDAIPKSKRDEGYLSNLIDAYNEAREYMNSCVKRITNPANIAKPWYTRVNISQVLQDILDSYKHIFDSKKIIGKIHVNLKQLSFALIRLG